MKRKDRFPPLNMAQRTAEVKAVGAWVRPEVHEACATPEAILSAQIEEVKMQKRQLEKEIRLKRFQAKVKHRVNALAQMKKQKQLEQSFNAAELQRHIVEQSSQASHTPRKNNCILRPIDPLTIGNIQDSVHQVHDVDKQFEEQIHKVHKFNRHVRQNLISHTVPQVPPPENDLPGGPWKNSAPREHPSPLRGEGRGTFDDNKQPREKPPEGEDTEEWEKTIQELRSSLPKMVRFDMKQDDQDERTKNIERKSVPVMSGTDLERHLSVAGLRPGVEGEEAKLALQTQRATYRRLYMDLEREQVKEHTRRRRHRNTIAKLKHDKEAERQRVESRIQQQIDDTRQNTEIQREETMLRKEQEEYLHHLQQSQRTKERFRYVDALKRRLRERVEARGIIPPALCSCGETLWDTNPDTCANNCVFYRDHAAYAKALQSLLSSCDLI